MTKYLNHLLTVLNRKCYLHSQNKIDSKNQIKLCNHFYYYFRCDQFYIPNFIQTSRSTTFGFGNKYDFSKTTRFSPPCNTYTLKNDF